MGREEVTEKQESIMQSFGSTTEYLAEINDIILALTDFLYGSTPKEADPIKADGSFISAMKLQNEKVRMMLFELRDIKVSIMGK